MHPSVHIGNDISTIVEPNVLLTFGVYERADRTRSGPLPDRAWR